ncbi:MAG: DHCW motif cupin fold protein [Methylococcaceae bacterium]|nr:DHCW motif cupin fold protein [Prolixibacteraceae bacterium]
MEKINHPNIAFQTIDWQAVPKTIHPGETGIATWQTLQLPGIRIRIVEYSENYKADHWCGKGHIVHCLEGEFTSESADGSSFLLTKGMTYVVSDELSSHRSATQKGVKLLIIDGDFLKYQGTIGDVEIGGKGPGAGRPETGTRSKEK